MQIVQLSVKGKPIMIIYAPQYNYRKIVDCVYYRLQRNKQQVVREEKGKKKNIDKKRRKGNKREKRW